MKLTREADKTLSAVVKMQEACAQICGDQAQALLFNRNHYLWHIVMNCAVAIRALDPRVFIDPENHSVHLAKPLAESAAAPGECGSVPDERAKFEAVAWMTDDGRVAMSDTKKCMPSASSINFNIPLYTHPAKTEQQITQDWVSCPVCGENHMRREVDKDGNALIFCVNHGCKSNGGKTEQPSLGDAEIWQEASRYCYNKQGELLAFSYTGILGLVRALLSAQRQDSDKDADKFAALERRYLWAVNELLACDYGDNDQGQVGWIVYGWRDKTGKRRIYGDNADIAIDRAIANGAPK